MLIKYEPKVEHLKCVALTPKEGLTLERTMVRLLPGTNEITNDEWKAMRGNITAELESGEIKTLAQKVSAGRGKVGGVKARDLKEMPVNLAIKYVSECNNPDTLVKWFKEITNEEVRLAITKKFEKLGIERPEDEIPDTPNEAPMSLEELDEDDDETSDDKNSEDDDAGEDDESEQPDYNSMTVAELKAICEEKGIDTKKLSKKGDFVSALTSNSDEE